MTHMAADGAPGDVGLRGGGLPTAGAIYKIAECYIIYNIAISYGKSARW